MNLTSRTPAKRNVRRWLALIAAHLAIYLLPNLAHSNNRVATESAVGVRSDPSFFCQGLETDQLYNSSEVVTNFAELESMATTSTSATLTQDCRSGLPLNGSSTIRITAQPANGDIAFESTIVAGVSRSLNETFRENYRYDQKVFVQPAVNSMACIPFEYELSDTENRFVTAPFSISATVNVTANEQGHNHFSNPSDFVHINPGVGLLFEDGKTPRNVYFQFPVPQMVSPGFYLYETEAVVSKNWFIDRTNVSVCVSTSHNIQFGNASIPSNISSSIESDAAFRFTVGALPFGMKCDSQYSSIFPCTGTNATSAIILYVNGILATAPGLRADAAALSQLASELDFNTAVTNYPNLSGGFITDILDSAQQRLIASFGVSAAERKITEALENYAASDELVSTAIRESFIDAISNAPLDIASEIVALVTLIRQQLEEHPFMVIVAHSQGNLLTNLAYQALSAEEKGRVEVVAVASPAAFVSGGGAHVTAFGDIIDRVPDNLQANTNTATAYDDTLAFDFFKHYFRSTYLLQGSSTRQAVADAITAAIERLCVSVDSAPCR